MLCDRGISTFDKQALDALGCDKTIYVTRVGGSSGFAEAAAFALSEELGIDPVLQEKLYEWSSTSNSSIDTALETQAGSVCVNWESASYFDFDGLAETGYNGNFISDDECLQSLGAMPYQNGEEGQENYGCMPLKKLPPGPTLEVEAF